MTDGAPLVMSLSVHYNEGPRKHDAEPLFRSNKFTLMINDLSAVLPAITELQQFCVPQDHDLMPVYVGLALGGLLNEVYDERCVRGYRAGGDLYTTVFARLSVSIRATVHVKETHEANRGS